MGGIMRNTKRILAALAACFFLGAGSYAQGGPAGSLAVGVLSDLDSVPIVIADMRGFFKDAGLEVRLERFPSAMNRDAALHSGALDLAVSDLLAASFALDSGLGVRVVQATQGAYRLMSAPGSRIKTISELKGKRIGISKNTIIEYALDRMLAAAGMQSGDIVKEVIPQMPLRLEALRAGKIDAAVLPEPLASAAALDGSTLIDSSERLEINPGVIIASPAAALNKAAALAAFRAAYDKAVEYLASAPP
jgi:NitT/TauT family transport system substrate-binding protein